MLCAILLTEVDVGRVNAIHLRVRRDVVDGCRGQIKCNMCNLSHGWGLWIGVPAEGHARGQAARSGTHGVRMHVSVDTLST